MLKSRWSVYEVKPSLVYCAAYTAVDAAEDEGKELDHAINVTGTENVAKASLKNTVQRWFIFQQTTFFDGENQLVKSGWWQNQIHDRVRTYKTYGWRATVEKHVSNYYIIRTAWGVR